MDQVFYWTGAAVWLLIASTAVWLAAIAMQAVVRASIDVAAQLWRARGMQRRCTIGAAWRSSFCHGGWHEIYFHRTPSVRSGFKR